MRFKHNREYFALVVVLAVLVFFVIGGSETGASPHPGVRTVYEYDPIPLIVDFNGDGIVNFKDFRKLAQYWLQDESSVDVAPPPLGDLMVDIQDLAVLTEYWLKGGRVVGPDGGTVSDPGGASVVIPPEALTEETLISVTSHYSMASLPAPSPFVGGARFGPKGLVFNYPPTITLALTTALPPGTKLALFMYDKQRSGWLLTEFSAVVNPDGLSASAEVTHFTDYIIMGQEYNDLYFRLFKEKFFDICTLTPISELFENYIDWFSTDCFTIGRKDPWDFSAAYAGRGYSCYQTTGIDYVLRATRSIPDPNGGWTPIETGAYWRETGDKGTVAMVFIDDDDKIISSSSCGEYQLLYSWDVTVHLACALPELKMEVGRSQLNVGQRTTVTANLICGSDGLEGQQINFGVHGAGEIWPTQPTTSSDGKAEIVLRAVPPPGCTAGTATVTAMYEACTGQEQQGSVDAEIGIDVPFSLDSLAGTWEVNEIADETGCCEEINGEIICEGINTYTYTVGISQSGSRITGTFPFSGGVSGRIVGCTTITGFAIVKNEDFGDTYGEGELTISQDGDTLTGYADWEWGAIDPDPGELVSCLGSSTFTLTRQECDVPVSLAGTWSVTVISDETACGEGINTYTDTGIISEPPWGDGSYIIGDFSSWYFYGRKRGCTITGFGGQNEDRGFTYGEGELTISEDGNTMDGHADWVWQRIDPYTGQVVTCRGSSSFAFRRE